MKKDRSIRAAPLSPIRRAWLMLVAIFLVLSINGGSSSIRCALDDEGELLRRLDGKFDRIGLSGTDLTFKYSTGKSLETHTVPEQVTPGLLDELRRITPYDPEHLPLEIELIEAFRQRHPELPQVACFDTAFHRTLPQQFLFVPQWLEGE